MNGSDVAFLESVFKKYFFDHFDLIHVPEKTSTREFGYQKFNSGMIRHISVKSDKELRLLLMQNVPSDVYCSNACYMFPNLPMKEKDWQEADLIFDIDAKDLNLPCRTDHTVLICNDCGAASKDSERCTACGSARLDKKSLGCRKCIDASKSEVRKLLQILADDLGIPPENVRVYFSGNEGFHVHVHDSQFQKIGSRERSDIIDYIRFNGAIPETFGMKKHKPRKEMLAGLDDPGWRGRFAREFFGSKSNRSKMIPSLVRKPEAGYARVREWLESAPKIGARIDPHVTSDVHRVFRLPGSLKQQERTGQDPLR